MNVAGLISSKQIFLELPKILKRKNESLDGSPNHLCGFEEGPTRRTYVENFVYFLLRCSGGNAI